MAWKWYNQVELCGDSLSQQPTLHDLQAYCLATQFLSPAGNPRSAWAIVGFGLRLAQDIGAHRKGCSRTTSVDDELEKRAVWSVDTVSTLLKSPRNPTYLPTYLPNSAEL